MKNTGYLLAVGALFSVLNCAQAADWSSTNIQLLYGHDYNFGSADNGKSDARTITLEHASGWEYGDNYFFTDLVRETNGLEESSAYGEFYTRLGMDKIMGTQRPAGDLFQGLSAGLGINLGEDFEVWLYGLSSNWNLPGFNFFQVDFYAYDDKRGSLDTTYQITPCWDADFMLGGTRWVFHGFADFIGARGEGTKHQILAQPQLLLDVGNLLFARDDRLLAGVEYSYWKNKYGVEGVDDEVAQAMLKWIF